MRTREGGRKRPCCAVLGDGTDEEVDEEGGGAVDADIDKVLVIHCGCVRI